jgi:hypothetical protein
LISEVEVEEKDEQLEEDTTEAAQQLLQGRSLNLEEENEVVAIVGDVESSVNANVEAKVEEEVKNVEGVKNIAEALVNIDKEAVTEEVGLILTNIQKIYCYTTVLDYFQSLVNNCSVLNSQEIKIF